jgi:TetR/AcrR family transcriptional regulator, transcriptional repressor for nem operon
MYGGASGPRGRPARHPVSGRRSGDGDRVHLDQISGLGKGFHADQRVGGFVVAEHRDPRLFFHHFASKLDLARSLVARYAAADLAHLEAALAHARATTDDPVGRVIAFARFFEDGADELMAAQSSCLYVSILTERQLAQGGTSAEIGTAILAWRTAIAELLRAARLTTIDAEALADHFFVTFEGALLLCRSTNDPGHMRAQFTVLRRLLESLLAKHG